MLSEHLASVLAIWTVLGLIIVEDVSLFAMEIKDTPPEELTLENVLMATAGLIVCLPLFAMSIIANGGKGD